MELTEHLNIQDIITEEQDLTPYMNEKDLEMIGIQCIANYKIDLSSREDYINSSDEALKLAMQVKEEKSFPWPKASNIKYPLLSIAAMQFSARAYGSLIPNQTPVKGKVIGFDQTGEKIDKAVRISKHMSYQILEQMPNWEEEMDKLCMIVPILGCVFKKTYYDPMEGTNRSELILPRQLVVNYWATSLEDASRVSHIIEYSNNDLHERQTRGVFRDDIEMPLRGMKYTDSEQRETSDAIQGLSEPETDQDRPYEFIEQHCWYDLDGDGYEEPYIIYVSTDNEKVYRIIKRFSAEDVEFGDEDEVYKITPDQYFTKFSFVPNPDGGFYDIGFGILLGPTNEAVNTIFNQLVDAGTLSNMQAGFLGRGIRLKKGSQAFTPGEWKSVQNTGDDLRKSIVPLPAKEPSGVLFNLLGLLIDSAQQLSSVSDMMRGESPGQNQPATTTMAVLEQGLQVYSSIYKRLFRSLSKEFKKLYRLNAKYLPIKSYFMVLGMQDVEGSVIGRGDYDIEQVDVVPSADPNVASEAQKLLKAQGLMELVQLGTVNPTEVTKRILEAQEQPGIDILMQVGEPQPDPQILLDQARLELDIDIADKEDARSWAQILIDAEEKSDKLDAERINAFLENIHKDEDRRAEMGAQKEAIRQKDDTNSNKAGQG